MALEDIYIYLTDVHAETPSESCPCSSCEDPPPPEPTTTEVVGDFTHVHLPLSVRHFHPEDCPCGCVVIPQEDPCDCDGINWNVWGNQYNRLQTVSGDPSLWSLTNLKQGTVGAPFIGPYGWTHYRIEVGDHDIEYPDRLESSISYDVVANCLDNPLTIFPFLGPPSGSFPEGEGAPLRSAVYPTPSFDTPGSIGGPLGSFECSPNKWNLVVVNNHYNHLYTTRTNRNYVPKATTPVPDCCPPSYSFHPCSPIMRMQTAKWDQTSICSTGSNAVAWAVHGESYESPHLHGFGNWNQLESGTSLLPGWGPSTVPNLGAADPSNRGEVCSWNMQLSMAFNTPSNPGGWTISPSAYFRQITIVGGYAIPGITPYNQWWYRTSLSPIIIKLPPGEDPCSIFPLFIDVPGTYCEGRPGSVTCDPLSPLGVRFSFVP